MKKKIATSILVGAMMLSCMAPAFAATAGSASTVPVQLTAQAATFSVTIPTSLPITVAADGTVTTATDAKIVNNSYGSVKVTKVEVSGTNGWSTVDYESADMSKVKVGTKQVAMMINNDKTTGADAISFTEANWPAMDGKNDANTDELGITYTAKVPAQSSALTGTAIANVVFTVDWNTEIVNEDNSSGGGPT